MKTIALALLLTFAATGGAMAASCPLYPADTPGGKIAAQTDEAVCQQQALSATTAQKAQQLQFQGDLNSTVINLEQEQRMQQMFNQQEQMLAPSFPVVTP